MASSVLYSALLGSPCASEHSRSGASLLFTPHTLHHTPQGTGSQTCQNLPLLGLRCDGYTWQKGKCPLLRSHNLHHRSQALKCPTISFTFTGRNRKWVH